MNKKIHLNHKMILRLIILLCTNMASLGCKCQWAENETYRIDQEFVDIIMTDLVRNINTAAAESVGEDPTLKKEQEKQKIEVSLQKLEKLLMDYPSITSVRRPSRELINCCKDYVNDALNSNRLDKETKKYVKDKLAYLCS